MTKGTSDVHLFASSVGTLLQFLFKLVINLRKFVFRKSNVNVRSVRSIKAIWFVNIYYVFITKIFSYEEKMFTYEEAIFVFHFRAGDR